jgi:hypothetical protein
MIRHFKTENIVSMCVLAVLGWTTTHLIAVEETQATLITEQRYNTEWRRELKEFSNTVVRLDVNLHHALVKLDNVEQKVICQLKHKPDDVATCL